MPYLYFVNAHQLLESIKLNNLSSVHGTAMKRSQYILKNLASYICQGLAKGFSLTGEILQASASI